MNTHDTGNLTNPPKTTEPIHHPALEEADDTELRALISRAQDLLTARETERKRQAIARIKEIAKAHGLDVAIETGKRARNTKPRKGE